MDVNSRTVRTVAQNLIEASSQSARGCAWVPEFEAQMQILLDRPDLCTLGVPREGNHSTWSSYLYFDGELALHLNYLPNGVEFPVHDHGVWEAIGLYRGGVVHTTYEVKEESPDRGRANLSKSGADVLDLGDVAIVSPPNDIHSLKATQDDTYILTAHLSGFKETRRYFQPDQGTYLLRDQKSWRRMR